MCGGGEEHRQHVVNLKKKKKREMSHGERALHEALQLFRDPDAHISVVGVHGDPSERFHVICLQTRTCLEL